MNAPRTTSRKVLGNDHAMNALLKIAGGLSNAWPAERMRIEALNRIPRACKMLAAGILALGSNAFKIFFQAS